MMKCSLTNLLYCGHNIYLYIYNDDMTIVKLIKYELRDEYVLVTDSTKKHAIKLDVFLSLQFREIVNRCMVNGFTCEQEHIIIYDYQEKEHLYV